MKKLVKTLNSKTITAILLFLALAASACLILFSCSTAGKDIRNVILISIDTCRADHLSCYGYPRQTTPNIDELARKSIIFTNAYTPIPLTLPAHSTMLTGTIPPNHGVHDNIGYILDQENTTLAEILNCNGFTTGAVISSYVLKSKFGLKQGFTFYDDIFEESKDFFSLKERSAEKTNRIAFDWLDKHKNEKFFLLLHYFDPHSPYAPPQPFASRFSKDLYAGEIAYTDFCIGKIISKLKDLRIYDSSLVIITSDHGEMLGEHGEMTHAYFIYQAALKVPLIFKIPGYLKKVKIDKPVSLADITPTVCSLLGIQAPGNIQGKDLSPYFIKNQAPPPDRYLYCESLLPTKYNANSLLGVVTGNWKFIQTTRPELYDLNADPYETRNLIKQEPNRARILKDKLKQILEDSGRKNNSGNKSALGESDRNRLESLGYIASTGVSEDFEFDQSKADPKDVIDFHELNSKGTMLIMSGKFTQAKAFYENMLRKYQTYSGIHYRLAEIAGRQNNLDESIKHLNFALQLNPKDALSHLCLGSVLARKNILNKAFFHLNEGLKINPMLATELNHNDLGLILAQQNNIEEAIKHFRKALKINPEFAGTHVNLGQALALQLKTDEAISHYNEALRIDPGLFEAHYNLGNSLSKLGKTKEAIYHLEEAIRINPNYAWSYSLFGDMLRHQGNIKGAIIHYSKAVELNPGFKIARDHLGEAHFMVGNNLINKGKINEALVHFQKTLQINNNSAKAHSHLGYALLKQDREDEAIKHCLEAIRIDPEKSLNAYYNLACIFAKRNKVNESVDWLKKAINNGFNDWDTLKTDKDLENIRNTAYYSEIIKNM